MTDYQAEMQQYVYVPDAIATDDEIGKLKYLAQLPLDSMQLQKLSTRNSERVRQFGCLVGQADTDTTLLFDILKVQSTTMHSFQDGYIEGIFSNNIDSAINRICDAVAKGQTIYAFRWFGSNGVRIKDLSVESLGKLVKALLKCDDVSQSNAQNICFLYYDKSKTPLPQFIRDILLAYPVISYVQGSFHHWKELLVRYMKENPADTKIISKSITRAIEQTRKHITHGSEWSHILTNMLELNTKATWNAILHHMEDHRLQVWSLLRKQSGVLNNDEALSTIHAWVNKDIQKRSNMIASILPSELDTMIKWMSVCKAKDKADVALHLLLNLDADPTNGLINMSYSKKCKDKITEIEKARETTNNRNALALLAEYESHLHSCIAKVFWVERCEYFGIEYDETPDEKAYRDKLREWLDAHRNIPCMKKLIENFDDVTDGQRRHDGHVWHAELVRLFYEDGAFTVEAAESDKVDERYIAIDIKLLDKDNPDDIINIQAWHGMTGMGHRIRYLFDTGVNRRPYNFDWEIENKKPKKKIDKLPKQGQNFLIQKADQTALKYLTSDELLPDHVCILQVYDCGTHVYYKPSFKYKETAERLAKILGKPYKIMEGDWSKKSDWLDRMYPCGQN